GRASTWGRSRRSTRASTRASPGAFGARRCPSPRRGTSLSTDDPRVGETARQLFRLLRRHLDEGSRNDPERVARIAYVQLTRPGRPGARLSNEKRKALQEEIWLAAQRFAELSESSAL